MIDNRIAGAVLAVFCMLHSAALAGGDEGTGRIAGRVTRTTTGEPLAGAVVVVVGTAIGSATDSTGSYGIRGISQGTHSVQARKAGFEPATVTGVEVRADVTTSLDFGLLGPLDIVTDTIDFGPDSLLGTVSPPVEVRLWAEKSVFKPDDEVYLHCQIKNISPNALFAIGPIKGCQSKYRLPSYHVSLVDTAGGKFPRSDRSCSLGSAIGRHDFVLLQSGDAFRPYGERMKLEEIIGKIPPGKYQVTLRFKCGPQAARGTPEPVMKHTVACDVVSESVEITILGE